MKRAKKPAQEQEERIPIQIKLSPQHRQELKRIAQMHGISVNALANMCLHSGRPIVVEKLKDLKAA